MGHRLSRIYTRTGDDGTTGLSQDRRLPKDHLRIETIGAVDELNAVIGIVLTETMSDQIRSALTEIQHRLFDLGGELSIEIGNSLPKAMSMRLRKRSIVLMKNWNP